MNINVFLFFLYNYFLKKLMPRKRYLRDKNGKLAKPNMKPTGRSMRISVGMGQATSAIVVRETGKISRAKSRSVLF